MSKTKSTFNKLAGERLKFARDIVFDIRQADFFDKDIKLADDAQKIKKKWLSSRKIPQTVRSLSSWENKGIPENKFETVANCFGVGSKYFTDPDITNEDFRKALLDKNKFPKEQQYSVDSFEVKFKKYSEEFGITISALRNFFNILRIVINFNKFFFGKFTYKIPNT